ncbi:hypothetical protein ACGFMM_07940 [Streptomyces sp. NPDC048604]|uniref:hypothetical protein n=1 Tax=Streptomyces sp. NPDC048604 TaxID=3365578 RepID=UPI00372115EF
MRSEIRIRDRFGAVLLASMSVLFVEAVIGWIGLLVWGQTRESPGGLPFSALGGFVLLVMAPFVALAGAILAALFSVVAVMPLMIVADRVGRRVTWRPAWWPVPALAAAVGVLTGLIAGVLLDSGWAALTCWFVTSAVLAGPALVARRLVRPDKWRISGGRMFGRVALYGTLAVVSAFTLAGVGLWAGIGYEPPQMSGQRLAGTWSDGEGGTLVLGEDGRATATGVNIYDWIEVKQECTGSGNWSYEPGDNPWAQEVEVTVSGCDLETWEFFGTEEHPKLFVYIGDPDSWNLYILERRG